MSKRTRYKDNSKRGQPVQQQRAQAALQSSGQKKAARQAEGNAAPPTSRTAS